MPLRDDTIRLTEREWERHMALIDKLADGLKKLESDQLVFKAKLSQWAVFLGAISGIATSVLTKWILKGL